MKFKSMIIFAENEIVGSKSSATLHAMKLIKFVLPSLWEDNIKIHLQEVGCGGMEWIDLAQDRTGGRRL